MRKRSLKRGMAGALAAVVAFGILSAAEKGPGVAEAADAEVLSSKMYATKEGLQSQYNLTSDETTTPAQSVYFGENGSGKAQVWKIAGKDTENGKGDNIVLFAGTPFPDEYIMFDAGHNEKAYDSTWGCDYGEADAPERVYRNHYGGSRVRARLRQAACDTAYFTEAQQALMNETTIATDDVKNGGTYEVTDKLYLPYARVGNAVRTLTAGTNSAENLSAGVAIDRTYLPSTVWMRTPYPDKGTSYTYGVVIGYKRYNVDYADTTNDLKLSPVFDLNLNSVLFASAAPAATAGKKFDKNKVMTFRWDGTNAIRSRAYYSETGIEIKKADEDAQLYLYVQGKDGRIDWVYSKEVTESEMLAAETIHKGVDLSTCKIWLETTSEADGLTYAKEALVPVQSTVTVNGGTGFGEYLVGDTVTITANAAESGKQFKNWEVVSGEVTLAEPENATTTFVMPASAVEVRAVYEEIPKVRYEITAGGEQAIVQNGDSAVAIRCEGDMAKFTGVALNGNVVERKYYTLNKAEGSLTLHKEYLKMLSPGVHTIRLEYTDGYAETTLTVKRTENQEPSGDETAVEPGASTGPDVTRKTDAPQTGDGAFAGYRVIEMLTALAVVIVIVMHRRKIKY